MSRKNISYVKGYEHSDFTDLLNELQGKKQNIEMADGALALDAPSSTESVCSYEESEERHRIMSDQRIKYLFQRKMALFTISIVIMQKIFWMKIYSGLKNIFRN